MMSTLRIVVIGCLLVVGCSKKKDTTGAGSAATAAPGSAQGATPAATAPSGPPSGGAAGCPDCTKFMPCCLAVIALPNSTEDKGYCEGYPGETRAEMCAKASAEMQPDMNNDCKERLADLAKENPGVAACK